MGDAPSIPREDVGDRGGRETHARRAVIGAIAKRLELNGVTYPRQAGNPMVITVTINIRGPTRMLDYVRYH